MNNEELLLYSGIELLVFKGEDNPDLEKYLLIEKLLRSLDDSNKYNVSAFNETDTKKLIAFYKETNSQFTQNLRSRFIAHFEYTFDESNFYKMCRGVRKPNIYLLNALYDLLLQGYLKIEDKKYSSVKPIETFGECTRISAYRYVRFCLAVSTIRREALQAYKIKDGNDTIRKLTTDDLPLITSILHEEIYISKYMHYDPNDNDVSDMYDPYMQLIMDEVSAPMPCELPQHTVRSYKFFCQLLVKNKKLTDALPYMSDELLIWLNRYLKEYASSQDLYFHQILFLLSFVSENTLNDYMNDVPPTHTLKIPDSVISKYYTDIKHMLELPFIAESYSINNHTIQECDLKYLNQKYVSRNLPDWLLFTLCHLTNKQLLATKYLYIIFVLRKRYHPQKDNDSFPSEIIELLRKNISDIDSIYDICARKK